MQTIAGSVLSLRRPWFGARTARWGGAITLASAVLLAAAVTAPDASWDLRNYHLYNGFAWLHGRIGTDLAPAQMQTFLAPLPDIAYALLLSALNDTPWLLKMALAAPQAVAAMLVLALARRLLPPWPAAAAALIGLTGAAALPTLGTAMSEMAPADCILMAVLLLVRADGSEPSERACFAAGCLGGAAVGLKLTAVSYALGLMVMIPAAAAGGRRMPRLAWFAAGGLIGAGLAGGFWWWSLWRHFGNPLFPFFNDIFRSPWGPPVQLADRRFMPRSVMQALLYPLFWALTPQALVSELPIRDPRIALGWIAALAIAARAIRRRDSASRGAALLPAFWALSYVAWEVCFSILRYLAALELLSGVLIMAALWPLLRRLAAEWQRACCAALVLVLIALTVYPDWGRAAPGGRAVAVALPPLPPDSLVILLDPSPMAYLAAFAPPGARFVGANNNLIHPGDRTLLALEVEAAIRDHAGPLWGLEMPRVSPGIADATLLAYGLRRTGRCLPVRSNLDDDGVLACELRWRGAGVVRPARG